MTVSNFDARLDPGSRRVLKVLAEIWDRDAAELGIEEARRRCLQEARLAGPAPTVLATEEASVPTSAGPMRARLYRGTSEAPAPCLLFLHGGGWVTGSIDLLEVHCRHLASEAACVVATVGYRLAPEDPFPAGLDDCTRALEWIFEEAERLGLDRRRLAVGGESAGGNLAAGVAIRARDRGGPSLCHQLLVYPALSATLTHESYDRLGDRYGLSRQDMAWFWELYLNGQPASGEAAPLAAPSVASLPPTHVMTAEFDPLRDEGEAYAARLVEAGVRTVVQRWPGTIHGFLSFGKEISTANLAFSIASRQLAMDFKRVE
jgi:acetyl esterase